MLQQLNNAMDSIEEALRGDGDMDIDRAARIACVTPDSFLRFFSYMTGMSLKEYVRRRKLTLAADELRKEGARVLDVAVKYGWNSADGFTKAFIQQHGITPTQARDLHAPLKIYPPARFHIQIKGETEMDFRIVEAAERTVIGISREFGGTASERFEAEHLLWADDCEWIPSKICTGYDGVWYGIWQDGTYTIARDPADVTADGLEAHLLPGCTYAVFTTPRGVSAGIELPKLHDLIHSAWLPSSEYRQIGDFELEVYHLWTDRAERRAKRYFEIWIPVVKK